MLIKKKIDPVALEVFKKHVEPVLPGLSKEERNLAYGFLIDPVEGFKEILKHYEISWHWHSDLEKLLEEGAKPPLLRMVKEYAEKKGWIYVDKWGVKHYIWEEGIRLSFDSVGPMPGKRFLPAYPTRLDTLEELKELLEEIKQKGAEKFLEFHAAPDEEIWCVRGNIWIPEGLVKEALGRVKGELTFEEALKIVNWLYDRWKRLGLFEAEERGWIKEEVGATKRFVWQRWERRRVLKNPEVLAEIKEQLKEIKEKGAEDLLEIRAERIEDIEWIGGCLFFPLGIASEALGRKVRDMEELSFEEAEKIVDWLLKTGGGDKT